MIPIRKLAALILLVIATVPAWADRQPVDWVRPQIDTVKPRWFYFSSACRPFGMVNLSPDTQTKGDWNAGYRYNDDTIECFSHFVITTRNNCPEHCYIQAARLNGQPWNSFQIPHAVVANGGTLELELGPRPNESWGRMHR